LTGITRTGAKARDTTSYHKLSRMPTGGAAVGTRRLSPAGQPRWPCPPYNSLALHAGALRHPDLLGELQQLGRKGGLLGVVLPGCVARDGAPFVDSRLVEIGHLGALLGVDVRDLLVVGLRL